MSSHMICVKQETGDWRTLHNEEPYDLCEAKNWRLEDTA
jgi:hypothetical protein